VSKSIKTYPHYNIKQQAVQSIYYYKYNSKYS